MTIPFSKMLTKERGIFARTKASKLSSNFFWQKSSANKCLFLLRFVHVHDFVDWFSFRKFGFSKFPAQYDCLLSREMSISFWSPSSLATLSRRFHLLSKFNKWNISISSCPFHSASCALEKKFGNLILDSSFWCVQISANFDHFSLN